MDQDPLAWAVHRHVVDATLDELGPLPGRAGSDPDRLEPEWTDPDWSDSEWPVFVVAHPFRSLTADLTG